MKKIIYFLLLIFILYSCGKSSLSDKDSDININSAVNINQENDSNSGFISDLDTFHSDTLKFFSLDDLLLIKMLVTREEKDEYFKSVNKEKYFLFSSILLGKKYNNLSDNEINFISCINRNVNPILFSEKIEDDFLKKICLGEDGNFSGDNPKVIKHNLLIIQDSIGTKEESKCNDIMEEGRQGGEYFLCLGLAFGDFTKISYLIDLYSKSISQKNCSIIENENKYLYEKCNKHVNG